VDLPDGLGVQPRAAVGQVVARDAVTVAYFSPI
jgi:hypothetical protein